MVGATALTLGTLTLESASIQAYASTNLSIDVLAGGVYGVAMGVIAAAGYARTRFTAVVASTVFALTAAGFGPAFVPAPAPEKKAAK